MKPKYIAPEMEVIEILSEAQLFCSSGVSIERDNDTWLSHDDEIG